MEAASATSAFAFGSAIEVMFYTHYLVPRYH